MTEVDRSYSIPEEDHVLFQRVRAGDLRAFDMIYQKNWVMIKDLILKNSGSAEEAKDIYQETMIVIHRRFRDPGFQLKSRISTFLYAVARNLWMKQLRSPVKETELNESIPDIADDMDQNDVFDERLLMIRKALNSLGEKCQKIIRMFYLEGATMDDIADKLGYTNSDNAKNQKYKCFKQLRSKLDII